MRVFIIVILGMLLGGCTTLESKSFVTSGESATIKGDKIQNLILADEEIQISHLNGINIGEGFAWPDTITVPPGEHVINLKYRQPSGVDVMSQAMSLGAHKKYDKSFKVVVLAGKTYIARLKPVYESTLLGPKRVDVEMWVEEEITREVVSTFVKPVHDESELEKVKFDEEMDEVF